MAVAARPHIRPSEDIGIALEDDTIVAHASGRVDAPDPLPGSMPFTADLRIRPFIPKNTRTVYASIKPDINVDADWFLDVLGDIVDFFGGDAFGALRRANATQMAVLFGVKIEQQLPDESALSARVEGRQVVIRPDLFGIYGVASITTAYSDPPTDATPAVVGSVRIRERFLRLQHGFNSLLAIDPTYRIRYRLRRGSNGSEVASGTVWSGSDTPFGDTIDLWDDANVQETAFIAELVAERPPGSEAARHTQTIDVVDLFDRSHPFVRWRKQHFMSGSPVATTRLSAIHRTAIRERCQFCDTGVGRDRSTYSLERLDAVPAPEEDGFSTRLCPYCFPPA
jgi:hypothetical protein